MTNKIIYLVSPPRSLSVAFTRMMYERGDFEIFHEPSQLVYNKKYFPEHVHWWRPDAPQTYDEVKNRIFSAFKESDFKNVFVKEMSFAVSDWLLNDPEFIQNENIYFVFLIRDPLYSAISFYKRVNENIPLLKDLLGYESLYNIFERVKTESKHGAFIIHSDELCTDPAKIIEKLCQHTNIPFIPESLSWPNLDSSFDFFQEWHENKIGPHIHHWHGAAINSTKFSDSKFSDSNKFSDPNYEIVFNNEIPNPEHREYYLKCYLENLEFYKKILTFSA